MQTVNLGADCSLSDILQAAVQQVLNQLGDDRPVTVSDRSIVLQVGGVEICFL